MTLKANIIIGANLGDEGKGLITDFYASQFSNSLIVRHNSGAQAGHTVTTATGQRHVFGHIGAGSFAGSPTYLSRFFVCNPLLFRKEYKKLSKQCAVPKIFVDTAALVSTPYDMMINQLVEEWRGKQRHGSCGVGFGETIERNLYPRYQIKACDLANLNSFLQKLIIIRTEWLPQRLLALGIAKIPPTWVERIENLSILEDYIDATSFFLRYTQPSRGLPQGFNQIICEGAQGLLLDQDHPWFPHVTRSSTGIQNAMIILDEAGIKDVCVTYITRSYLTRHGAGPLPFEIKQKPYEKIVDATNITNDYQGALRFAWLDIDRVAQAITNDLATNPTKIKPVVGLAVSCVDQIDSNLASFVENGKISQATPDIFLQKLYTATNASFGLASYGPTRQDVKITNFMLDGQAKIR